MTPDKKITICKKTREIASESLFETLKEVLSTNTPISEKMFRFDIK